MAAIAPITTAKPDKKEFKGRLMRRKPFKSFLPRFGTI
jgi:hypothetical protein